MSTAGGGTVRTRLSRWVGSIGEPEFWNPDRWQPRTLYLRYRGWIRASRRRRWTAWIVGILFALFVFPGVIGGIASAFIDPNGGFSGNSATSGLGTTDSSGVPLANYTMVIDHGSIFNPGNTVLGSLISLIAVGWLAIDQLAIWGIDSTLSFGWLDMIATPLHGAAKSFAGQVATPVVFVAAVTIGGGFVAYFVVRGLHSKATMQVVTMLMVAVLSPVFLADPLGEVLSSDGLLAKGRDVGVAVAAGLNGEDSKDSTTLVKSMQGILTDNLVRKPLQVWNFGHVVDDQAACKQAWSAGITAGDDGKVRSGLRSCGDTAAYAATNHPTWGQVGAGLLLLVFGGILLLFAAYLSINVVWSALDAIYHGVLALVGFAAGGYVYGPPQSFTISNVVHGFIAGWRMTAYIVFIAFYLLFIGDLFDKAGGQVITVIILAGAVMVIMIFQFDRIGNSITKGGEAIAGKISSAVQSGVAGYGQTFAGAGFGGGGGGGGGGMGIAGHALLMSTAAMQGMSALGVVANSPLTEWLAGGVRHPLSRNARMEYRAMRAAWRNQSDPRWLAAQRASVANQSDPDWLVAQRAGVINQADPNWLLAQQHGVAHQSHRDWLNAQRQQVIDRRQWRDLARAAAVANGGLNTPQGATAALTTLLDHGVSHRDVLGMMEMAGLTDSRLNAGAVHSWGRMLAVAPESTFKSLNLGYLAASTSRLRNSMEGLARGHPGVTMDHVVSDFGTVHRALNLYREQAEAHVRLDELAGPGELGYRGEAEYVRSYLEEATEAKIKALQEVANGNFRLPDIDMIDDPLRPGVRIADPAHENYELYQAKSILEAMPIPNYSDGSAIPTELHDEFKAEHAGRMMDAIAHAEFRPIADAYDGFRADPGNPNWFRNFRRAVNNAQRTERLATGMNRTTTAGLQSPGWGEPSNPGHWHTVFDPLGDRLAGR
ncbi:hypothetical protein [Nocardia macrotermitis]|uniref:TrbL/VirB6 plasmid conjugal transfer protein n=1 Tax=Nocardia macrotermitis TaxID=2585198 RepID=A0A7K0DD60_9NOCA|nr:hypothetical protein [Nocardia macrotermitis]MQY23647.1 hypothetical protein [Nocardia macrotermitis]